MKTKNTFPKNTPPKPVPNVWVIVSAKGLVVLETLSWCKMGAIGAMIKGTDKPWKFWYRKYGYRAVKVNVSFTLVEKIKQ